MRGGNNDTRLSSLPGPIGIFDSGYGGLTIFEQIKRRLPQYDYLYLGDNARTPYGSRSFEVVYEFTRQAVYKLFEMGCHLVILACNTASAKALRTIQQCDIPVHAPHRRVLGVIRPTVESIGPLTQSKHVGILATEGTIQSESYPIEIHKLYPSITVVGKACPMWVPLIENRESNSQGADYFVSKSLHELMTSDPLIDTLVLGCTHYPLLLPKIRCYVDEEVHVISQGELVAASLESYLARHPEIVAKCTQQGECRFVTTESPDRFKEAAAIYLHETIEVERVILR